MSSISCFARAGLLFVAALATALAACDRSPPPEEASSPPATTRDASPPVKQRRSFRYDGPMPDAFHEAPGLTAFVTEGKLPPVHERLRARGTATVP